MHELPEDVSTLAEYLTAEGYRSAAFIAAGVLDHRFGLSQGFEHYDDDLSQAYEQGVPEALSLYRPGNLVVDASLDWLDREARGESFFAWVHLYDAHVPWHDHGEGGRGAETGTYDGEVAFVDRQVDRLMSYLRDNGLEENTLVVAVADHGEGLCDHHEMEHAYLLNEEVLHVPWIMSGPGIQPGHRVPALVSLEDLMPTTLDLLGLPEPRVQGRSLKAALRGEAIESVDCYAETDLPWTAYRWAPQRSLTTENWKYIRTPQFELYDRTRDRSEYANLAEVQADRRLLMEKRLQALENQMGQRESSSARAGAAELAQLAALGYAAGSESQLPEDLADLADIKERLPAKDLATELRIAQARGNLPPGQHLEVARRLVSLSPETPAFHGEMGAALVTLNDLAGALPHLARHVQLDPTHAGALYAYGDALQLLGRTQEARAHLELALELQPEMAPGHVGMGNVLRAEGRPDMAAGEYMEALRLQPQYPEAYYNLALTFLDRDLHQEAAHQFEMALKQRPGWGAVNVQLARLFLRTGQVEDSITHFEAALEVSPQDPTLHNDLGAALYKLGRIPLAKHHFGKAIGLRPDFFRPHVNLGNVSYDHGQDEQALQHYEQAFRLAPNHPEPLTRLAFFLATTPNSSLRDGPRAIPLAQRAVDLTNAQAPRMLDALAAAYASVDRFPEAIAAGHRAEQLAHTLQDSALARVLQERLTCYALEEPIAIRRVQASSVPSSSRPPVAPQEPPQ